MEENDGKVFFSSSGLLTVCHPVRGDVENGKKICNEIRKMIGESNIAIRIFHDATTMTTANAGYASAFKKLDEEISERVAEIVCAIPGAIPRMMAYTVATLSQKKWSIYKNRTEAEQYIKFQGH